MSQRCHCQCCNITIRTIAVLIFAVTVLCSFSLSQRCTHFRCHSAVLIFAVTALCSFSLSQRCAHRCLTAVGLLLRTNLVACVASAKGKGEGGVDWSPCSPVSLFRFSLPPPPPLPLPFCACCAGYEFYFLSDISFAGSFLKKSAKIGFLPRFAQVVQ